MKQAQSKVPADKGSQMPGYQAMAPVLHCISNEKLSNICDIVSKSDHDLVVFKEANSGILCRVDLPWGCGEGRSSK